MLLLAKNLFTPLTRVVLCKARQLGLNFFKVIKNPGVTICREILAHKKKNAFSSYHH